MLNRPDLANKPVVIKIGNKLLEELVGSASPQAIGINEFDTTKDYSKGDVVAYEDKVYVFTSDHTAGAWSGSDAQETTVMDVIATGTFPELTAGNITPKSDALTQSISKFAATTTGGDIDILSGSAKLLGIRGNLDENLNPFNANRMVYTKMNLVDPTDKFEHDDEWMYFFPVVAGVWDEYGTTQENNGYVVIGDDVTPNDVYFTPIKPVNASTIATRADECPYHEHEGKVYYLPPTDGWMCIFAETEPACHIAWSNYNDDVRGEFGNINIGGIEDACIAIHSWGMASVTENGTPAYDEIDVEGQKLYRRVDRVYLSELAWAMTEYVDAESGTTTFIFSAAVAAKRAEGAWACLYRGLQVNGTTLTIESTDINSVAELKSILANYVFYYALATEVAMTFASQGVFLSTDITVDDFGLTYFIHNGELVSTPAWVKEGFRQSGKDQLFNAVSYMRGEMSEVIAQALAEHEEKINAIVEAFRNGLPSLRVEELTVARRLDAYIAEGNFYLKGAGAPAVLPQYNGQEYFDTTNAVWYKASYNGSSPTAEAWKRITNA